MSVAAFMLYFFGAVAAMSAIALVWIRQVFYGAILVIICLLSLAGIFALAFAEFLAVTQIMVYAGGILVVIIFGIMLTSKISGKPLVVDHTYRWSGMLAGSAFFAVLVFLINNHAFVPADHADKLLDQSVQRIGTGIMTEYLLPFEIAGLLLLIALIGAAVIAATLKTKSNDVSG